MTENWLVNLDEKRQLESEEKGWQLLVSGLSSIVQKMEFVIRLPSKEVEGQMDQNFCVMEKHLERIQLGFDHMELFRCEVEWVFLEKALQG